MRISLFFNLGFLLTIIKFGKKRLKFTMCLLNFIYITGWTIPFSILKCIGFLHSSIIIPSKITQLLHMPVKRNLTNQFIYLALSFFEFYIMNSLNKCWPTIFTFFNCGFTLLMQFIIGSTSLLGLTVSIVNMFSWLN